MRNTRRPLGVRPLCASALMACLLVASSCAVERRARGAVPLGVATSWTAPRCLSPDHDRDADGVDDACELALARDFAPELIVDPHDCSWDAAARPARLGGGYLFAAEAAPNRRAIRIAYMPAYYVDCGWQGLPCVARGAGCAAHGGDSEIIVLEMSYDPANGRWITDAIFLSAHCFGPSGGRCRWYVGEDLRYFSWARGARRGPPRIWVAKGKHANYPSPRECDTGHWYYDSCDENSIAYRFPILSSAQNVGSRGRPLPRHDVHGLEGCIAPDRLLLRSAGVAPGTRECFWDPAAAFRGWRRLPAGEGATSYSRVLRFAAGF